MAYSTHIFVKYKPEASSEAHAPVKIASTAGEYIPIPDVCDIIDCKNVGGAIQGKTNAYQVLSRYFTYSHLDDHCSVFLTIADAPRDQTTGRVKG